MNTLFLRAARADGETVEAGNAAPLNIIAATAGLKSDGVDLAALPWDMRRGKPVDGGRVRFPFLWAHDLAGGRLPLGYAYVGIGEDGTTLDDSYVVFDPADADAVAAERKYRSEHGGLDSFSITWDVVDADGLSVRTTGKKPAANQLLEVSAVPVPLDAGATVRAQRGALADLGRQLLDMAGPADDDAADGAESTSGCGRAAHDDGTTGDDAVTGEGDRDATAAEMVTLYTPALCDPDDDARRRTYRALAARYKRLGMAAPEFVPLDELAALDDDNWRALFLNGEVDDMAYGSRVSMVLAARNRDRIDQAHALLGDVLKDADAANKAKAGDGAAGDEGRGVAGLLRAMRAATPEEAIAMLQEVIAYLQDDEQPEEDAAPAEDAVPADGGSASAEEVDADARAFVAELDRLLAAVG